MEGRICYCGSNKTSFRVFLMLHLIIGVASFIFSVVGMYKVLNWTMADILYEAESHNLEFDPKRAQSILDIAGVVSIVSVFWNLVNLLFLFCGFFGEAVKHTRCLAAWNFYLTTLLTFSIFSCALAFISGPGQIVLALALVAQIVFLSFSAALTRIRRKEIKMDKVAAARSGGEAGGFECNGEQAAVDSARVECPRDLPIKYSDICEANAKYP